MRNDAIGMPRLGAAKRAGQGAGAEEDRAAGARRASGLVRASRIARPGHARHLIGGELCRRRRTRSAPQRRFAHDVSELNDDAGTKKAHARHDSCGNTAWRAPSKAAATLSSCSPSATPSNSFTVVRLRQVRATKQHLARSLVEEPLFAMGAEIAAPRHDFSADQRTHHHVMRGGRAFQCLLRTWQPPDLQQWSAIVQGAKLFEDGWIGHWVSGGCVVLATRGAKLVPRQPIAFSGRFG